MVIDVNVEDHTYKGLQKLIFTNNSPDNLDRVFYHLYFNAFKPGTDLEQNSRYSIDDARSMGPMLIWFSIAGLLIFTSTILAVRRLSRGRKEIDTPEYGTEIETILEQIGLE